MRSQRRCEVGAENVERHTEWLQLESVTRLRSQHVPPTPPRARVRPCSAAGWRSVTYEKQPAVVTQDISHSATDVTARGWSSGITFQPP